MAIDCNAEDFTIAQDRMSGVSLIPPCISECIEGGPLCSGEIDRAQASSDRSAVGFEHTSPFNV